MEYECTFRLLDPGKSILLSTSRLMMIHFCFRAYAILKNVRESLEGSRLNYKTTSYQKKKNYKTTKPII